MKKLELSFTETECELINWCIQTAFEQNNKFLRHDGWTDDMSASEIRANLETDSDMIRASKVFTAAYNKARGIK